MTKAELLKDFCKKYNNITLEADKRLRMYGGTYYEVLSEYNSDVLNRYKFTAEELAIVAYIHQTEKNLDALRHRLFVVTEVEDAIAEITRPYGS